MYAMMHFDGGTTWNAEHTHFCVSGLGTLTKV